MAVYYLIPRAALTMTSILKLLRNARSAFQKRASCPRTYLLASQYVLLSRPRISKLIGYIVQFIKPVILAFLMLYTLNVSAGEAEVQAVPLSIQQNTLFRDEVMRFVKQTAWNYVHPDNISSPRIENNQWINGGYPLVNWCVEMDIYLQGKRTGKGEASANALSSALEKASFQALKASGLNENQLKQARFKVTFYYPPDNRQYSIVDSEDKGVELIGEVVPLRIMDTNVLKKHIELTKSYLLRMMDPEFHAFFKRYDAALDQREPKLRTIYTASSLLTLLKIQEVLPDPEIERQIQPIANFLLSMQEQEGMDSGAFHYSYDKVTGKKDQRFVVGTASKTIFTLLTLYQRTKEPKYLEAAEKAGNWLLTRVEKNGSVYPVVYFKDGQRHEIRQQSFLYSGQVLSALSRLYTVTQNKRYYEKASQIADRFVQHVNTHGAFVSDEYRLANSVSTSWLAMSLMDYAKVNPAPQYRDTIRKTIDTLLALQINEPSDAFNHGRLMDASDSSSNGWVNEVMTVLYPFCLSQKMPGCDAYRQFIILSSRWLMQDMYTPANSYAIKNPAMAEGGIIRNFVEKSVRTDAVCHGGNSLVGLLEMIGPEKQTLLVLPERPIQEVIGLLRIGKLPED